MKSKTNYLQLGGACFFTYFLGGLLMFIFPLDSIEGIYGMGIFALIGFMIFLYATFSKRTNNESEDEE